MTTLIHLARSMDIGAIERLQVHARRRAHGETLGLNALTHTLIDLDAR